MELKKTARAIFVGSIAFLVLTISSFTILYQTNIAEPDDLICAPIYKPFCGNNAFPKSPEGKKAFNENCAACHKLSAKCTGPALRNVDSLVYRNWMHRTSVVQDSSKFGTMGIEFHWYLASEKLDSAGVAAIFEYTR